MPSEVPSGWSSARVSSAAKLRMGETIVAKNLTGDGIPVYSAGRSDAPWGFTSASKKKFQRGTVVVGARGSLGHPRLPEDEVFVSTQTTIAATPADGVSSTFLCAALGCLDFGVLGAQQAVPMLTVESLGAARILLPPLPEQKKIAAILSSVDEAIAATQAVIEQTRRVKEGLLQDLLTRGIGHTRFKQTEIGEIPEGWGVRKLGSEAELITKGASPNWQGFEYQGEGMAFITSKHVRDGHLDLSDVKHLPMEFNDRIRRSELRAGDLLINIVGASIGRAAIWDAEFPVANVNQAVALVRMPDDSLPVALVLAQFLSPRGQDFFGLSKVDNARPNVSLANLRNFPVAVPPSNERSAIRERLQALERMLRSNTEGLAALEATKAGLLQDLLTGKVRVSA